MSSVYRAPIFASYRRLYRARIALFRGDDRAMNESRKEVRKHYLSHGHQPLAPTEPLTELILMADEAAHMLRHSIVQSKLNDQTGHYEAKLKANHVTENTGTAGQPPLLEPITSNVVSSMEAKQRQTVDDVRVEQTKATGS